MSDSLDECSRCGVLFDPAYPGDVECASCKVPAHLSDYEWNDIEEREDD